MEHKLVGFLTCAVKYHELTAFELIYHEGAHVCVVRQEGTGVHKQKLLINTPFFRHVLIERIQHPHAVIFHKNARGPVLFLQCGKARRGKAAFCFDGLNKYVATCKRVGGVFLFALFAKQQQRALPCVETRILQRLLNETRFARL